MAENDRLGSEWVRRPAAGGPAEFDIKIPDGSTLAALEKLLAVLHEKESRGKELSADAICNVKGSCQPIVEGNCAWHVSCRIV